MENGGNRRVLGLDPISAERRASLEARGIGYRVAGGIDELLASMRGDGCDLVLASGLEELDSIRRAMGPDDLLPVAIHSTDSEIRRRALEAGADAALSPETAREEWAAQIAALIRLGARGKALTESKRELERLSLTDDLTGLHNKRWLLSRLAEEISRADRYREGVALILLDLDHFKRINDAQGHLFGDEVLVAFAEILRQNFRTVDRIARYGGEEFAIILPETSLEGGRDAAERFRVAVEETSLMGMAITISAGVAAYVHAQNGSVQTLLGQADEALYLAKRSGRNRVIAAGAVPAPKAATS